MLHTAGMYRLFIAVTLLSLSVGLQSSPRMDYYASAVPVKSQSAQERVQAAREALLNVIVRMSGSDAVRNDEAVRARTGTALRMVEQFQYLDLDDPELKQEGYSALLRLTFSASSVRELLQQTLGLPFWSESRPNILVWLVEDSSEFGKQFVLYDPENPLVKGLQVTADYRGLPLSFPLLDFEDQSALSPESAWELDELAILEASRRYAADVILVGNVTQTSSGRIFSNWEYFHDETRRIYDARAEDQLELGRSALTPLANYLASKLAVVRSESAAGSLSLRVSNVRSFADYAGLMQVFTRLDAIGDVQLISVDGFDLVLQLRTDAPATQFSELLKLSRSLTAEQGSDSAVPVWQQAALGSSANPLRYRWQR